jgi:saccharopine dehydrogenase-like NADP-dependent oxidoreductase
MIHLFQYQIEGIDYETVSYFGMKGENENKTAMAKTVGLPLGIVAKLLMKNHIKDLGLHLPLKKSIYRPVLKELSDFGINFQTVTGRL